MTAGRTAMIVGGMVIGGVTVAAFIVGRTGHSDITSAAERAVKARLTDPYSAQFSAHRVVDTTPGFRVVCGNVNSKNRMGGYVGNRPFVYDEQNGSALVLMEYHELERPYMAFGFKKCGIQP